MSRDTLQTLLLRAREFPGTGLRFVDGAERESFLPWSELAERAAATGGKLAALGVRRGERVALVYPTGPEFFDAFFGILLAGAVPVPLYPPVRLGRLAEYHARTARMLEAADAVALLADPRLAPLVGEAVAAARPRHGCLSLESLPGDAAATSLGRPDDLGLVQFSSGTTVEPKPVALEQRALLAQVRALNALWPDRDGVRQSGVSWLPLYHDMGLIGCVFPALERPTVLTLIPPERFVARPALWLRAIARHRATVSVAPNFAYALAAERIRDDELAGCDLASWRVALCGAETVSADTLRRFAERFAPWGFRRAVLAPVYGLSEAALAVTFPELGKPFSTLRVARAALAERGEARPASEGDAASELVSVGRPLAGFRIEVRDDEGKLQPERRVGRVFVTGPSLFREYLGQPLSTAQVLRGEWLDTGDLGFLSAGELYLTGRAKDLIILRGRGYAPDDLERAADEVPGARRGCAAALSYRRDGEETDRLLLFVEHRRRLRAAGRATLGERCREAVLTRTGLPVDEVHVLAPGTLPRTSSGKIRRGETLRRHLGGRLAPPRRVGLWGLARAFWRGRRALRSAAAPERSG